jgi:hypothetical protein
MVLTPPQQKVLLDAAFKGNLDVVRRFLEVRG